jgi:hypothetical protein
MHSKIAEALGFKGCGGGCAMVLFAQVTAKGKTAAFDKDNFGCFGGGMGLGFGRQYENFPLGGIEAFKFLLSTGLEGQGRDDLAEEACSLGRKELVEDFLQELPATEVSARYVVFLPLGSVGAEDVPAVVVFLADAHQISALIGLANYDRPGVENVFVPMGAGCHQIGIYAFREAEREHPRAVLGLTDISARKNVRHILGEEVFTFALPYQRFLEMENNVKGSFLERSTWRSLAGDEMDSN